MAELQEYEEVRPVRRVEKHVYDDIKNVNKMDNVSSPTWKQYFKILIIVIPVSLLSAVVTYFTVNAQLQQKLELLEKKNGTIFQETKNLNNLMEQLAQFQKKFSDIEKKIKETEIRHNLMFSGLQKNIKDSTEQVAMTAQVSSTTTLKGIIKFEDVMFSVGINNLPLYKSTGKFVVEKEGLYLMSAHIMSQTNDAFYYIYLNGKSISGSMIAFISPYPNTMQHSGTIVVVRQLRPNDNVSVVYTYDCHVRGSSMSQFNIVKIK